MTRLHPSVAGFGPAAGFYERARPEYPDALVDWLVATLGLEPGATVVDVGAGTGKLTRPLLARGLHVLAIEPIAGMRAALEASTPGALVLDGTAEALPVADGAAGAVVAAQAFHWFANDAALAEFARVLRPEARLGIVWNARDLDSPLQAALHDILRPYRSSEPRHAFGAWQEALERSPLFTRVAEQRVRNVQVLDADGVVDRALSTSFIAALPQDEQARVAARVRALVIDPLAELVHDGEAYVYGRT